MSMSTHSSSDPPISDGVALEPGKIRFEDIIFALLVRDDCLLFACVSTSAINSNSGESSATKFERLRALSAGAWFVLSSAVEF